MLTPEEGPDNGSQAGRDLRKGRRCDASDKAGELDAITSDILTRMANIP